MMEFNLADMIQLGVMIGAAAIYIFLEAKKWRFQRKRTLEENLKIDAEIYKVLWHLQGTLRAVRVYITQFHNGDNFYTGQSIQRQTVSHEVLMQSMNDNIKSVKLQHCDVLIDSMYHDIIIETNRSGIYYEKDISQVEEKDRNLWMQIYGVKSLYYFRISDKSGRMIAMLNLHWNTGNPLQDREVTYVVEQKKKLETIFNKI